MSTPLIRVYNPRDQDAKVIDALLTGRDALRDEALVDLRRMAASGGGRQHWLLRGPRGYGKTHFLGALRNAVLADPDLERAYFPVWLPETAVYSTYSTAKFLLRIVEQIGQDAPAIVTSGATSSPGPGPAAIRGSDDQVLAEAEELLQEEARRRGRTLLVLCENLDVLLDGFSRNRKTETKRLRRILEHSQELLFVFTTPVLHGGALADPKQPLYGMFRDLRLSPLSELEVRTLITRLDAVLGGRPRSPLFADTPEGRHRLRTIHRLAGGNPRAVVMAYQVLSDAREAEAIVHHLRALLDAQTAYFEALLGRFAARERAIMAALCLSSTTLTLAEIAEASHLSDKSLSVQVGRMVQAGHLEPTEGVSGKGAMYQVTDGLFRLWYQYREGHVLLDTVVGFLSEFHSLDDLRRARIAVEERCLAAEVSPLERADARIASLWLKEAEEVAYRRGAAHEDATTSDFSGDVEPGSDRARELRELRVAALASHARGDSEAALVALQRRIPSFEGSTDVEVEDEVARTYGAVALLDSVLGDDEGLASFERVIARFGDATSAAQRAEVARALVNKGVALKHLGRLEAAFNAYSEVVARFGDADTPSLQEGVAQGLVNRGVTLVQLGQVFAAIRDFAEVVERFGQSNRPALQAMVATALVGRGVTLGQEGHFDSALRAFAEVVERFRTAEAPTLREFVAKASFGQAAVLESLKRADEAMAAYAEVVAHVGASSASTMQQLVAQALVNRGASLQRRHRSEEALREYSEVVERFAESDVPVLREAVAEALIHRSITLEQLGRAEVALDGYAEIVERFGASGSPTLREHVARALLLRASSLVMLGKIDEGLAANREVLDRFSSSTELELRRIVLAAEVGSSLLEGTRAIMAGRYDVAVAAYREVVGKADEPLDTPVPLHTHFARAQLAHCLFELGQDSAAASELDQLFKAMSAAASTIPAKVVDHLLRLTIATAPLGLVREKLDSLSRTDHGALAESARLYLLVVNVLEEGALKRGRKAASGPRAREKRALRRVPPELRSTVAELVAKLAEEREALGSP